MRDKWPGRPRQSLALNVACSTASAMRSRAPHRSSATRPTLTSRPTRTAAARSSLSSMGFSRTSTATFPAGCYIRNPPTSSHTPGSTTGCTIFVKLWQFDPNDRTHLRIDTGKGKFVADHDRNGVELCRLFQDSRERVRLERWAPNAQVEFAVPGGIELMVLDGGFSEGGESFVAQSWLRLPSAPRCKPLSPPPVVAYG